MTYDEYTLKVRARVKKYHSFELWLKKHKAAVIAVTVMLFAAVFAVMYFSGSFIKGLKDKKFVYGEHQTEEKALAFLSGVSVSYTEDGKEEAGFPTLSGEYDVSAKTVNPFGVVRQSGAHFTIEKRRATVSLHDFTVQYGDEPDYTDFTAEGLADGDTAYITGIKFDKFEKQSNAEITGAVIKNKDGEDVTSSYELTFNGAVATVTKRKITVVTGSAEKKWDGEPLKCREYGFEYGSLAYSDVIFVKFTSSLDLPGTDTNKAEIKIYDGGADATDRYAVTLKFGTLQIMPRKIKIETGTAEKEYDGEPLSCKDYAVTYSDLLDGHGLVLGDIPSITNTGKIRNRIDFRVKDENESDYTQYYDIEVTAGTLTVKPREIVVKTPSYELEYDGNKHWPVESIEIVSGELFDGDTIELQSSSSYLAAGTYRSMCTLKFGGAVPASAYNVTFDYGTVLITKRPLTVYYKVLGGTAGFTAVMADTDGMLAKKDSFASASTSFTIPLSTDYGEFEEIIKSNIKIYNTQNNTSAFAEVTNSYDITVIVEYDKDELDEAKSNATEKETETVTVTVTETDITYETGTADTGEDTEPVREKTPEEVYGDNGIGSGGVGGGIGNSPSPYSGLPQDSPEQKSEPLGYVRSFMAGAVYLRLRSFGNYTGTGWAEPAIFQGNSSENPLNMTVEALYSNGYAVKNELNVKYNVDDGLVPVPYYSYVTPMYDYKMTDIAVPAQNGKDKYFSYNQIPLVNLNVLKYLKGQASKELEYSDFAYANYLSLPENTKNGILRIIEEAGLDKNSPTIITDVAEYVKNSAEYSGSFEKIPDGEDRVLYFLTKSKQGVCSHFASAATVIYRALGIPARYTVGYYVVTDGGFDEKNFYTKDAHAWVEVYLNNVGWVPVEVTGSSVAENGRDSVLQPPDNSNDIFYNKLFFKMKDVMKDYDGTELVSDSVDILPGGNLKDDHRIEAVTSGIINCGTIHATSKSIKIYDKNGTDVTDMYEIAECAYAEITVNPLIVYMPEISLYVGQTISVPDYAEITDERVTELTGKDKIYFDFDSDYSLSVTGEYITGLAASTDILFTNEVELGTGIPDKTNVWEVKDGGEEVRFRQKVVVLPFENVRIKDGEPDNSGGTVTRITGENGKIYNYLAVRSSDASKHFDGEYLSSDGITVINGALANGHKIEHRGGTSILYAGEAKNLFSSLCVTNEKGVDVTGEYIIDFYPGTLTVYTSEYNMADPVVTVSVNGEYDLTKLVWAEGLSNIPVSYDVTGEDGIVRVQSKTVIGIEPGKTYIGSYLSGADLNGDGVPEYLPAKKQLEVNVTPNKTANNAYIYVILIAAVALASAAVTYMIVQSTVGRRKG